MYFMGMYEFQQYMYAAERLEELTNLHDLTIRRAYADIHPTRMAFNTGLGKVYSESINVAEYAIWLIEMKEGHFNQREFWRLRAAAFDRVVQSLSAEDKKLLQEVKSGSSNLAVAHRVVLETLKKMLEGLISSTQELRRGEELTDYEDVI